MRILTTIAILASFSWVGLWCSPEQFGQRLFNRGEFQDAAKTFQDPYRQGVAWFRAGEFEKAEQSFARVGTSESEYNRGNSLVMLGKYDAAVGRFDRAIELNPTWEDPQINREIAATRAKLLEQKGGDMGDQKIGADEIIFDKSNKSEGEETQTEEGEPLSDSAIQELWLRRVQTKPASFLKAKFAYQLAVGNNEKGQE